MEDIEIAKKVELKPISQVAKEIGLEENEISLYGKWKAKISLDVQNRLKEKKKGNLILVSAINPTPLGEGKTTISIGLADGLRKIGEKSILALREPSLGPVFGIKGGATGGGYAQVAPMEDINLHFTGDIHAITAANNLLAAMIDNHIFQGNDLHIKEVTWKRCMDLNDRQLRKVEVGLSGEKNMVPREDGFDITVASEIMAILCLAKDGDDLRRRIENILLGTTIDGKPFRVKDMGVAGAICALLKDALHPNLVQTTENTPAIVHGGPFANIAHGCNSVVATKLAMTYADYVVTEAGFGADLGAEKFFNIKCRKAGLQPRLTVIVATTRGLKMHGGVALEQIGLPEAEGLRRGFANLDRHVHNIQSFGQSVVVCFNRYDTDTDEEIAMCRAHCEALGVGFAVNSAYSEGGRGAEELARLVVDTIENRPSGPLAFTYADDDDIEVKAEKVARDIYGAAGVTFSASARRTLERIRHLGAEKFPVCIAKTQYSFSADAHAYGVPTGFKIHIREVVPNIGAELVVLVAGDIMRMPGLPRHPQAEHIDVVNGEIVGLS